MKFSSLSSRRYINLDKTDQILLKEEVLSFILHCFCGDGLSCNRVDNYDELLSFIDDLKTYASSSSYSQYPTNTNTTAADDGEIEKEERNDDVNKNKNKGKNKNKNKKEKKASNDEKKEWKYMYDNLSPNVIIYNIIPFYELRIDGDKNNVKNDLELFGYFKYDKMRNIWFVFSSLCIDESRNVVYFNDKRVKCLRTYNYFKENNNNNGKLYNFDNLEVLEVFNYDLNDGNTHYSTIDTILKRNKFGKLKKIEAFHYQRINRNCELDLKGIKELKLNLFGHGLITCLSNVTSLKYLSLIHSSQKGFENWDQITNVEVLNIHNCSVDLTKFFQIHKLEKLKKLRLKDCKSEWIDYGLLQDSVVNWVYIQKMEFHRCNDIVDKFFQSNRFINLKELIIISCNSLTGKKWNVFDTLNSLVIKRCDNFEEIFFARQNISRLESFTCVECKKVKSDVFEKYFDGFYLLYVRKLLVEFKSLLKICFENVCKVYFAVNTTSYDDIIKEINSKLLIECNSTIKRIEVDKFIGSKKQNDLSVKFRSDCMMKKFSEIFLNVKNYNNSIEKLDKMDLKRMLKSPKVIEDVIQDFGNLI